MDPEKQNQDENKPSLSDHGITKKIAKKAFTVLRGVSTAGGSGVGAAGAAIAVILIILFITIITTIGGGGAPVNAGTPPTTELPPPTYTPTCDEIDSYLVSLNIDARGITDCGREQLLFTTVLTILSYPGYKTLIGDKPLVFIAQDDGTSCGRVENYWGCTKTSGNVWLKNFNDPNDRTPWQYVITHELFHVLKTRNSTVFNIYKGVYTHLDQGKGCYRGSPGSSVFVIATYDLDTNDPDESYAESGALYILGGRKNSKGDLSNFQTKCPENSNFWSQAIGEPSTDVGVEPPPIAGSGARCTAGNTSTCGGKYNISKNQDGLNFGDPSCELTSGESINKDLVRSEIMSQLQTYNKTKDYCRWSCIAHFEGGYNPNSYNGNASRPRLGGWGMFQFLPWACYTSDKPYYYNRTGNVSWKQQIARALALEYKMLEPNNLDWRYWSTYKWTCHKEPDWSSGTSCLNIGQ